jgi:surfeit locus 1 family protein
VIRPRTRRAVIRPFWARPKWVVGHVLMLVLVATFVAAGLWQLRRLDERLDRNRVIEARGAEPVVPVGDLVGASTGIHEVDDLAFRRVEANGRYDAQGQVLVRNRSFQGRPGVHVITPLVLADGAAVLVNRGFVATLDLEAEASIAVPLDPVAVTGLVTLTQERGSIGPRAAAEGRLDQLNRLDIGRIAQQYGGDLLPIAIQLETQDPAAGALPVPLPPPELGEGPHRGYAAQWFVFAAIGVGGWIILLRRTARDQAKLAAAGSG